MIYKAPTPFTITQNWKGQAENLKLRFTALKDVDLAYKHGEDEDVLTRIGHRFRLNRGA